MRSCKYIMWNIPFLTVLFLSLINGWGQRVYYGDSSGISVVIAALFAATLFFMTRMSWQTTASEGTKVRLVVAASTMTGLGMLGTVYGFIYSLLSVDPSTIADVGALPALVASLLSGMGIALYTTLVGLFFAIWTLFVLGMHWGYSNG